MVLEGEKEGGEETWNMDDQLGDNVDLKVSF